MVYCILDKKKQIDQEEKMTAEDILKLRDHGEVSKVQFKERILDKYDIGCELVAMSNARGGQLVIGINDKTGAFNPLSYAEVQEATQQYGFGECGAWHLT